MDLWEGQRPCSSSGSTSSACRPALLPSLEFTSRSQTRRQGHLKAVILYFDDQCPRRLSLCAVGEAVGAGCGGRGRLCKPRELACHSCSSDRSHWQSLTDRDGQRHALDLRAGRVSRHRGGEDAGDALCFPRSDVGDMATRSIRCVPRNLSIIGSCIYGLSPSAADGIQALTTPYVHSLALVRQLLDTLLTFPVLPSATAPSPSSDIVSPATPHAEKDDRPRPSNEQIQASLSLLAVQPLLPGKANDWGSEGWEEVMAVEVGGWER